MSSSNISRAIWILIAISVIIRSCIAGFVELGNDEVYYWLYAKYPDLSHFDHPPLIGWVIQFFSLDLLFDHAFFLRLPATVFGAVNTWMIYRIGWKIKDQLTGLYAALLYNASIYCFIIAGTFILPDAPQMFFWVLSLLLFVNLMDTENNRKKYRVNIILLGLTIGLGMISKYTSVFLWFGIIIYVLLYERRWLKYWELYMALIITGLCFVPVLLWNINNEFISFTFQGERINFFGSGLRFDFIGTEILGQIFYNNPVNVFLIVWAIISFCRGNYFINKAVMRALLLIGLPLIVTFMFFSFFRQTLPHWSGPAYTSLIIITAAWLRQRGEKIDSLSLFPRLLKVPVITLCCIIVLGFGQIQFGWFPFNKVGIKDFTVEMYGWDQIRDQFDDMLESDRDDGRMKKDAVIISRKWFPAAHLDYYVAQPLNMDLFAVNSLNEIHKYAWINQIRGGLETGIDAYYFTSDQHFKNPNELYSDFFAEIESPDTLFKYRCDKVAGAVYVFRLKNLLMQPEFGLPEELK